VRTCSASAFGDLGRGWQKRAVVAGPLAFVGVRDGVSTSRRPHKILVVVEPNRVATVTLAVRSRAYAALGYNRISHTGSGPIPLARGTQSVRFEACGVVMSRPLWNRGTQFPGYFLVSGRRCVQVEITAGGKTLRRTLRFGVTRCP
jgi:hypothetical protein